jgi:hypothetical protein
LSFKNAEPSQKNGLLCGHEPIETRDRGLEQSRCLPAVESHIECSGVNHRSHAADDGILLKIKQHQRRTHFGGRTRREGELAEVNFAEH